MASDRQAANPLSRSRPSPSPMAGELLDDRVIVDDPAEGSGVYNRGFFGTPRSGGGLELNLLEAVYLVEGGRLEVRRRGRAGSARGLFRAARASMTASGRHTPADIHRPPSGRLRSSSTFSGTARS